MDLADYDAATGNLDICPCRLHGHIPISRIYLKQGRRVSGHGFTLRRGRMPPSQWGNVDGDEYPDLAISGHNGQAPFTAGAPQQQRAELHQHVAAVAGRLPLRRSRGETTITMATKTSRCADTPEAGS